MQIDARTGDRKAQPVIINLNPAGLLSQTHPKGGPHITQEIFMNHRAKLMNERLTTGFRFKCGREGEVKGGGIDDLGLISGYLLLVISSGLTHVSY
ncbi:hypothetical protein C8R32_103156 [Nitrosospira sp. Nsp5]|uniref:Uncharacterized protein n=1 Tax=Nitrosospira multiformis TaxID=1231 RepID=A0ABY0T5S1_9PROT|nr:hypothetical protein C8R32_103156 [Nitrosospira sp. Nsp5]SDQ27822.1 hypothetical protein SAMN05216402_0156 [Nitrosospira multiformis]